MKDAHYFAGIGCRRGVLEESLRELLEQSLEQHDLRIDQLGGLASIDKKVDEIGLLALAKTLALPLQFFSADQLSPFSDRVTPSAVVAREVGAANIAEACALAAAEAVNKTRGDQRAELIIRKCKNADATFAVARASNFSPTQASIPDAKQ
ncbi:MAG: cobalamin biosynthesis protein [Spongiibacteraceae bacterium]